MRRDGNADGRTSIVRSLPRPLLVFAVVSVLVAVGVVGGLSIPGSTTKVSVAPSSPHPRPHHSSQQPPRPAISGTYVALGSSYASGPDAAGINSRRCLRNLDDYPAQVADALGLALTDVTCSGSTTANILAEAQHGRTTEPQLDAVKPDTSLVTITTGGNDIDYIGRLTALSCASWLADAPAQGNRRCHQPRHLVAPPSPDKIGTLEQSLSNVLAAVRSRAPRAVIVVVDYLPVLSATAQTCPAVPLPPEEAAATVEEFNALTEATRAAAERNSAILVRASAAGVQHTACSPEPWVYGLQLPVPFHPNAAGRKAMAQMVLSALRQTAIPHKTV